jgi:hypothetical protein
MDEAFEAGDGDGVGRGRVLAEFGELYDLSASGLGEAGGARVLAALETLREVRGCLDRWEPALITAARGRGLTWAQIAPALGLASRQAAERRYLRLNPHAVDGPESTREGRVEATRNERSADRAVADWARGHAAELRQLAGQLTAVALGSAVAEDGGSGPSAPGGDGPGLDRLRAALAGDDAADLVDPLTSLGGAVRAELRARHPGLADQVSRLARTTEQIRDNDLARRTPPGGSTT